MEIFYKSPETRAHILRYLNKNTYNLSTRRVIMEMKAIDIYLHDVLSCPHW